ncbi:MAG: hypothetical protein AAF490_14290 [Chloroflexota bacterium]
MIQRIQVLASYFLRRLVGSVSGALYLLFTLGYWLVLFNPQQLTPDTDYFILVAGLFGPIAAFLITLTFSNWANQAINYPFLVRLPSRVEYLTALFISALVTTMTLQLILAILAIVFHGPDLSIFQFLEIPPLWLAPTVLAITLAMHATDLVSSGWSRVYIFGLLALFLFGQNISNEGLIRGLNGLSRYASNQGWFSAVNTVSSWTNSLANSPANLFTRITNALFWPFDAIARAILNGNFTGTQALAPAILMLYATILFILAADLFVNKDLILTEA